MAQQDTASLTLDGLKDEHLRALLGLPPQDAVNPRVPPQAPPASSQAPGAPSGAPAEPIAVDPSTGKLPPDQFAIRKKVMDMTSHHGHGDLLNPKPMLPPSIGGAAPPSMPDSIGQPAKPDLTQAHPHITDDPMAWNTLQGPGPIDTTGPASLGPRDQSEVTLPTPRTRPAFGTPPWQQAVAGGSAKPSLGHVDPLDDQNQPYNKDTNPAGHKSWGDLGKLGKLGRVALTAGNIGGDILAPGTMKNIPGTDLNNQRQLAEREAEYDKSTVAEKERADADKAKLTPNDKFVNEWTDDDGVRRGLRESGKVEEVGKGSITPAREQQNVIDAWQEDPFNPANIAKVEAIKGTWTNAVPLNGTIEHSRPMYDRNAPQILARYNNYTGKWEQMGDVKEGAGGKPIHRKISIGNGMEQEAIYADPNDPTKYTLSGKPAPIGSLQPTYGTDVAGNQVITGYVNPKSTDLAAHAGGGQTQQGKQLQSKALDERMKTGIDTNGQRLALPEVDGNWLVNEKGEPIAKQAWPPSPERTSGETAQVFMDQQPRIKTLEAQIDQKKQWGQFTNYLKDQMNGKYGGASDPAYAEMATLLGFATSGAMKTHFGSRGGQQMYPVFKAYFDTAKTKETFDASLKGATEFMNDYAKRGGITKDEWIKANTAMTGKEGNKNVIKLKDGRIIYEDGTPR